MPQAPAASTPSPAEDPRYEAAIFPVFLLQTLAQVAGQRGVEPQALCRGLGFGPEDLDDPGFRVSYRQASLMIRRALHASAGNRARAAKALGIQRQLLYAKIERYGLRDARMSENPTEDVLNPDV